MPAEDVLYDTPAEFPGTDGRKIQPFLPPGLFAFLPLSCRADYIPFDLPKGLTRIEDSAFAGLPGRGTLIIPDEVEYIGPKAFKGTEIHSLFFPKRSLAYDAVQKDSFDWNHVEEVYVYKGDAANPDREKDLWDLIQEIAAENPFLAVFRTDQFILCQTDTEVAISGTHVTLSIDPKSNNPLGGGWQWQQSRDGSTWTNCQGNLEGNESSDKLYTFVADENMAPLYRCRRTLPNGEVYITENTVSVTFIPGSEINLTPYAEVCGTSVLLSWDVNPLLKEKAGFSVYVSPEEYDEETGDWIPTALILIEDKIGDTNYTVDLLEPKSHYCIAVSVDTPGQDVLESVDVITGEGPDPVDTVYRALLIAEVNFPGDICNRNMSDIRLMRDMLRQVQGASKFGDEGSMYHIAVRKDPDSQEILEAIRDTFKHADDNDVSLFFIATHGDVDDTGDDAGRLYTPAMLSEDTLLLKDLAAELKKVPGKIIVILGSCGSGAAIYDDGAAGAQQAASLNAAVIRAFAQEEPRTDSGRGRLKTGEFLDGKFLVLTSAAYQQMAWGLEGGEKPRNYFIEEMRYGVLRQAQANDQNQVTLNALYQYLRSVLDNREFPEWNKETGEVTIYHQYVQVWPRDCDDPLFRRIPGD